VIFKFLTVGMFKHAKWNTYYMSDITSLSFLLEFYSSG